MSDMETRSTLALGKNLHIAQSLKIVAEKKTVHWKSYSSFSADLFLPNIDSKLFAGETSLSVF